MMPWDASFAKPLRLQTSSGQGDCAMLGCFGKEGSLMRIAEKRTAAAIALAAVACVANAQMGGGMRRSKGPDSPTQERENPAPAVSAAEQLTASLYDLRMRLLITPAQAQAWESFYARWMDRAGPKAAQEPADFPGPPALQAVQRQLARERNRVAMTESLYAATQNLYDRLTPEQQGTADQWLPQLLASATAAAARPSKVWTRDAAR
jgi:hypothetical protein